MSTGPIGSGISGLDQSSNPGGAVGESSKNPRAQHPASGNLIA